MLLSLKVVCIAIIASLVGGSVCQTQMVEFPSRFFPLPNYHGPPPCQGPPPYHPPVPYPMPPPTSPCPVPTPYLVPTPYPVPPPSYFDDTSALLLLTRALEKNSNNDNVNSGEIINKLINALVYTTTSGCTAAGNGNGSGNCPSSTCESSYPVSTCGTCPGGAGGTGGTGGTGGNGGTGGKPGLIDLDLLSGKDLLQIILAGKKLLSLDVGDDSKDGGAVTGLLNGLL